MTGQTRFGHVTFPQSRASEVPESQFVTKDESKVVAIERRRGAVVVCSDESLDTHQMRISFPPVDE